MKRTLKLAAEALKPANLARGLSAARNPPSQAEIDAALAHATPEHRAAYQAQVEHAEAGARLAYEGNRAREEERRALYGPAGVAVYGPELQTPEQLAAQSNGASFRFARVELGRQAKQSARDVLGRSSVREIEDPLQRAHVAAHERAVRDEARAPYNAPERVPVHISRLMTRGKTQLDEVLAYVNGSGLSPDRMFGVYRVPDRISQALTPHSEKGRPVEWDIVHSDPDGTTPPIVATAFAADDHWVAKRVGEPSVLDEELALAYCVGAGIGPEQCAGLARISEFRSIQSGDDHINPVCTLVRGVVALHPPTGRDDFARMRAAAPLYLHPPADVRVEVLNWAAIARAVHTRTLHPPETPSPFPYLPSTPQELLRAYLEIVGLHPQDCYSAQATVDGVHGLSGAHSNTGPKQPCVDGKDRMRAHGCRQLVFVYRDRPEYEQGRARWAAYQHEQLQSRLERGTGARRRIESDELGGMLGKVARAAELIDRLHWDNWFEGAEEDIPRYRYCWPPLS
ncbi:hypothetical protein OM076_25320 [Solirubrobacter ginsenosidimutans]|uniref:Uncharacterized protein n=1 Tax=Solirubrobacter ginsenosidimutans TaxID=490573 RepID=A0A9X3S2L3_9ACTN|nr:hypothetical protein [Solirubrobacter ginsenosidimutans]MDA0163619.1 hypothetical protein [Solirubrobacter ginsenosidimutans]